MSGLIVLLSCGKKKQNRECPASEMYTSSLFRKSLQLARRLTDDRHIYILSAKYGLLPLRERIRPYEMCLNTFTERERGVGGHGLSFLSGGRDPSAGPYRLPRRGKILTDTQEILPGHGDTHGGNGSRS